MRDFGRLIGISFIKEGGSRVKTPPTSPLLKRADAPLGAKVKNLTMGHLKDRNRVRVALDRPDPLGGRHGDAEAN